jgi:hypothetical protein
MPSKPAKASTQAPPAYTNPHPGPSPKLPGRIRLAAFIPLALALIAILMVVLIGPAAAASWVDSDDDDDPSSTRSTGPSTGPRTDTGARASTGQVPLKLFKVVPFLLKVRSEARSSTETYFYGATNQCVHQAIAGPQGNGTSMAVGMSTGVATCGTQTMFRFLSANAGQGTVGMGNLVKFDR